MLPDRDSILTESVHLLDRFICFALNLTQKLFESPPPPVTVPRTITCRAAREQKNLRTEIFLASWPSRARTVVDQVLQGHFD